MKDEQFYDVNVQIWCFNAGGKVVSNLPVPKRTWQD